MRKAIINTPFTNIQGQGEDYPYYESDVEGGTYEVGDRVLVLREVTSNSMGKLYVIYNERINQVAVVTDEWFDFI